MMGNNNSDIFLTLKKPSSEGVFKEKGSKFLAYAYPLNNANQVEGIIQQLKKKHPKARHWCYAWQTGVILENYRYNDDGEPNNSAGKPIFGQIQSFGVTNVLVVVVRYFGGTKLGVGGLISAYRSSAKLALENSILIEKMLMEFLTLKFDYPDMDKVMRVVKENGLNIIDQKMELNCLFKVSVRRNEVDKIEKIFKDLRCLKVTRVSSTES